MSLGATLSFSDPNASKIWELLAKDPPVGHNDTYSFGNFTIAPNQTIPYSMTFRALEPGIYNVQTEVNVEHGGVGLGPAHTVRVTGPALKPMGEVDKLCREHNWCV
jgi:methane/ammonia monooxygenase subunit B